MAYINDTSMQKTPVTIKVTQSAKNPKAGTVEKFDLASKNPKNGTVEQQVTPRKNYRAWQKITKML